VSTDKISLDSGLAGRISPITIILTITHLPARGLRPSEGPARRNLNRFLRDMYRVNRYCGVHLGVGCVGRSNNPM
jgi:hypothetical protein